MKKSLSGIEKRKYIRLDKPVLVRFRVVNETSKKVTLDWHDGISRNIGIGGVCLEVYGVGTKINKAFSGRESLIEIMLPFYVKSKNAKRGKVERINVVGRCVWNFNKTVEGKKAVISGITFLDVSGKSKDLIIKFIAQHIE